VRQKSVLDNSQNETKIDISHLSGAHQVGRARAAAAVAIAVSCCALVALRGRRPWLRVLFPASSSQPVRRPHGFGSAASSALARRIASAKRSLERLLLSKLTVFFCNFCAVGQSTSQPACLGALRAAPVDIFQAAVEVGAPGLSDTSAAPLKTCRTARLANTYAPAIEAGGTELEVARVGAASSMGVTCSALEMQGMILAAVLQRLDDLHPTAADSSRSGCMQRKQAERLQLRVFSPGHIRHFASLRQAEGASPGLAARPPAATLGRPGSS
jgi:hypothetical protein